MRRSSARKAGPLVLVSIAAARSILYWARPICQRPKEKVNNTMASVAKVNSHQRRDFEALTT